MRLTKRARSVFLVFLYPHGSVRARVNAASCETRLVVKTVERYFSHRPHGHAVTRRAERKYVHIKRSAAEKRRTKLFQGHLSAKLFRHSLQSDLVDPAFVFRTFCANEVALGSDSWNEIYEKNNIRKIGAKKKKMVLDKRATFIYSPTNSTIFLAPISDFQRPSWFSRTPPS